MKFLDRCTEMKKEVKWSRMPCKADEIRRMAHQILSKGIAPLPKPYNSHRIIRALFIPESTRRVNRTPEGVLIVTGDDLVRPEG